VKTLVVMNQKGGVGKTTITTHAGWYFARKYKTLLIDLDQQGNLSYTMKNHLSTSPSVGLFSEASRIAPSGGLLTVAPASQELGGVEGVGSVCIEVFRDSIAAMKDDYEVCVIDTPPALNTRTFGAILSCDAILAPIGIGDYAIQGVTELVRAYKGVSQFYGRSEPKFLGLLPSLFDRKSLQERLLFQSLIEQTGDLVFPAVVTKKDVYARSGTARRPVWEVKTKAGQQAGREMFALFDKVSEMMEISL
jgi:chromosome partitioning protein